MTPRLRTLIDHVSRQAEADAVLLCRFADTRDPQAFAELVRRYGRLVWGQCRNLLNSETDADDAFQATFLTLAKSVRNLRDTNKLGPWLHGVAYRVCLNSRRLAARRTKREKATAKTEATRPVADSAWDQAFAAVHDELTQLPDTLRVPFVLCVLEGKGTTEAAAQLGLKLGTFSARLSRAKQQLFDRLSARGLTAGLAAVGAVAVGASSVPAAAAAKACDLAAGGVVPPNILSLSHGVLNMAMMNAKRWVMAVALGCGLTVGGAGVWTANAQDKKPDPKPMPATADELKRLQAEAALKAIDAAKAKEALEKAQADAAKAADALKRLQADENVLQKQKAENLTDYRQLKTKLGEKVAGPEFRYFGQGSGYAPTAAEFERVVKQVEAEGYTFVGVVTMKGQTKAKDNEAVPTLVFRRAGGTKTASDAPPTSWAADKVQLGGQGRLTDEELIARWEAQLADLKAKQRDEAKAGGGSPVALTLGRLGGTAEAGSQFVTSLVRLKFGEKAAGGLSFDTAKDMLVVKGLSKEQAVWLSDTVNGLTGDKLPK